MVAAVVDGHAHAGDRRAGEDALFQRFLEALVAGRDVFPGDDAADDLIDELVLTLFERLDETGHASVLAGTTGLFLVDVVELGPLGNGLAVGHLRRADFDLGLVLAFHPLDVHFEMQLAHAGDDGLVRLVVDEGLEGGVLLGEPVERLGHVDLRLVVHRLDGQADDRCGHVHGTHRPVERTVAEGVARGAVDAEQGDDVTGAGLLDLFHLVGVHAHQAAHLGLLAGAAVDDGVPLPDLALIGANVGQLAVAAVLQLEGQRHQRVFGIVADHDLGLVPVEIERGILDVRGAGQVGIDRVQQQLDALVLVGRADHHRGQFQAQGAPADGLVDHRLGDVAFLEHGLHEFVGEHGHRVEQFLPFGLGLVAQIGGDLLDADIVALLALEIDGLHGDQVDHALQVAFQADGHLDHNRVQVQLVTQLLGDALRIGAGPIAFIDKGDPGDLVSGHLPVDGDGLRLDPADRAEDEHRAVEDAQGPLHLDGEVNVPGGVNDVDIVVFPGTVGSGRLDGDAALPLQFHVVHSRADTVLAAHLVDGVNPLGEEQYPFRQGGFARIDVGADTDIPYFAQVFFHHAFLGCRLQVACLGRERNK